VDYNFQTGKKRIKLLKECESITQRDGGGMFFRNVGSFSLDYNVVHPQKAYPFTHISPESMFVISFIKEMFSITFDCTHP
jgi:hypothetical protein